MLTTANNPIRTRVAPSPTGYMHIGTLRTALYTYLFAKQQDGQFIVRLEDTDTKRFVPEAAQVIYDGLKWAGLEYDEGPDIGGPHTPYVQSERLETYKKYAQELLDKGCAYHCFCAPETLEQMRQEQIAKKQAPKYDRRCLALSDNEVKDKLEQNMPYVIRMKIPENRVIEFDDIVRGKITYSTNEIDDQVLLKSDGYPTYHLAVVVDDHLMKISHITRTEEWLPSTPKHILLYEYFGWKMPKIAHLPLLLNSDKTKMSKRKGDVAVGDYIKKGYLPHAMVNFLAFMGWNPGTEQEVYLDEKITDEKTALKKLLANLMQDFDLNKVHKAGAIFNIEKLNWYNQFYIKQLSDDLLLEKCRPYLSAPSSALPLQEGEGKGGGENFSDAQILKMLNLEKERAKTLAEIGEGVKFFFNEPLYERELLQWKKTPPEELKNALQNAYNIMKKTPDAAFTKDNLQNILMPEAEKLANRGILLWPLRAALSGLKASPSPFEIAEILGKEKSLRRIENAIKLLCKSAADI